MARPRAGSMFSGCGGIDVGLLAAGFDLAWHAEIEPACNRVLAARTPNIPNLGDVKEIEWGAEHHVDVIAAGFPCQPVSVAGRQLAQDDPRWLWPQVARAVRLLRPRVVMLENVPGLLARGLGDVLGDLAALGYDAEWTCFRAADVGAPHGRLRWWCVAHDTRRDAAADAGGAGAGRHSRGAPRAQEQAGRSEPGDTDASRVHRASAADPVGEPVRAGQRGAAGTAGAGTGEGAQRQRVRVDDRERGGATADPGGERPHGGGGADEGSSSAGRPHGGAAVEGHRAFIADADGAGLEGRGAVRSGAGERPSRESGMEDAADPTDDGSAGAGGARGGRPGPADGGDAAADADVRGRQSQRVEEPRGIERAHGGVVDGRGQNRGLADAETFDWGVYGPAIRQWESIIGRRAPRPTDDRGRLNPEFVEWMMGFDEGWTDVPGVSRTKRLFMLGNSVQVQCGELVAQWAMRTMKEKT